MIFSAKNFSPFLLLLLLTVCALSVAAQSPQADNSQQQTQRPLGKDEEENFCRKTGDAIFDEMRIKMCIKEQQREYKELLDNGEEAAKLSSELEKTFEKTESVSSDDQKKLDRLEKLFKKIRNSLGGEDDEEAAADDKPLSVKTAIASLRDRASDLLSELKKTTRYSVSVVAIQSSNAIIKLVKFIRFSRK